MELNKTYKRPYTGTLEQIKKRVEMYCKQYNLVYTDLIINNNNVTFTGWDNSSYEDLVVKLIRTKYSLNEELAILRKSHINTTDEYHIYNAYVEQCKLDAKQFIEQRNKALEG